MAKHAKLCPPSGWDRWSVCSASVDLQTNEGSEFAAQGTAAHHLADFCFQDILKGGEYLATKPSDWLGQIIWVPDAEDEAEGKETKFVSEDEVPLTGWSFMVDHEMADNVQLFIDEVMMQERDYMQSETEVPIGHVTGEEGATGHADVLRVHGKTLATHDLKYGKGVKVYARDNGQQLLYLLGGAKELDWMDRFDKFEIHIHQPRLGHHDVWYLSREELLTWAKTINKAAYRITSMGEREFQPEAKACKFCDYRKQCEARSNMAMATPDEFPDLRESNPDDGVQSDGEYMAAVLDRVEFVEAWAKDMWKRANEMATQEAGSIPGWDMFPGRGSRKIIDEEKVKARLRKRKFKVDDYAPRKMCSAAQLEKIVGKDEYRATFSEFVEHYEGSPKLGRVGGKRKSVQQQSLDAFDNLKTEED